MSSSTTTEPVEVPVLDRDAFTTPLYILAIRIAAKDSNLYLQQFKSHLFNLPKMKRIYHDEHAADKRLLLLDQGLSIPKELIEAKEESQKAIYEFFQSKLPQELIEFHEKQIKSHEESIDNLDKSVLIHKLVLNYEHFSADEVLQKLLGDKLAEVPSSFEQAGHIAHMNLRDEAKPYRYLIGQVILNKNPSAIRTVVNKVGNIETEFRTFPLEVIAGEANFEVTLKESNALFHFNFAEVYWNSRLQMEHLRMITKIRNTAATKNSSSPHIVADMMGGVGPFAIPLALTNVQNTTNQSKKDNSTGNGGSSAAKKSSGAPIMVHANDLNPSSYKYLLKNIKVNNVGKYLLPYNMDGRLFIVDMVEQQGILPHETIMNLPQTATDFLDVFIGFRTRYVKYLETQSKLSKDEQEKKLQAFFVPRINVYAFSTHPTEPIVDIVERCAHVMRCKPEDIIDYEGHIVRDVAPKKVMVCLSFPVPKIVAEAEPLTEFGTHIQHSKKRSAEDMLQEEEH